MLKNFLNLLFIVVACTCGGALWGAVDNTLKSAECLSQPGIDIALCRTTVEVAQKADIASGAFNGFFIGFGIVLIIFVIWLVGGMFGWLPNNNDDEAQSVL